MSFITLEDARVELRITDESQDDYISKLIERADTILLAYIGFESENDFYYEHGSGPKHDIVEAAAAAMIRNLYDRGDENPLTDNVKTLLRQVRDVRVG